MIFDGPDKFLSAHVQDVSGVVAVARARSAGHPREQIPGSLPGGLRVLIGRVEAFLRSYRPTLAALVANPCAAPCGYRWMLAIGVVGHRAPCTCKRSRAGWASVPGVLHA